MKYYIISHNEDYPNNPIDFRNNELTINTMILEIKGLLLHFNLNFTHLLPLLDIIFIQELDIYYHWSDMDKYFDLEETYTVLQKASKDYHNYKVFTFISSLEKQLEECHSNEDNTITMKVVLHTLAGNYHSILPLKLEQYMLNLSFSNFKYVFHHIANGLYLYESAIRLESFFINIYKVEERLIRSLDIITKIKQTDILSEDEKRNMDLSISQIVANEISESYKDNHQYKHKMVTESDFNEVIQNLKK